MITKFLFTAYPDPKRPRFLHLKTADLDFSLFLSIFPFLWSFWVGFFLVNFPTKVTTDEGTLGV